MEKMTEADDRITSLPDDLLHRIMGFLDATELVRSSILSTRWKCVWTTVPFLNFEFVSRIPKDVYATMVKRFFSTRNDLCQVLKLKLNVADVFTLQILEKIVTYAVQHGVEDLNVRSSNCKLSIYKSSSVKKLRLTTDFDKPYFTFLNQWNLPILHTLHLEHYFPSQCYRRIPIASLNCLPSLISLTVVRVSLPVSLDLPLLQTLILLDSDLPEKIWNLPCLNTLEMTDIHFPSNFGDFLAALVQLENLRIISSIPILNDCIIASPRLINLELKTTVMAAAFLTPHILVLSPHISNISVWGIILITCGVLELERVNINLQDCILDKAYVPVEMLKQFYCRLFHMLSGLGGAKILKIDFDTFEALSEVSNYLELLPSPFYKLNYVKLPQGCKECSISATLRKYLLGSTPGAAIVTTMPLAVPVSPSFQKVIQDDPFTTLTSELKDFQDIHKEVSADAVEKMVKVENVRQAGAAVAGTGIDQASSSRESTDIWDWKGHKAVPVSTTNQKVMLEEPLATLTKELVQSQGIHTKICVDTVGNRMQSEDLVKNCIVDADRVRRGGTPVAGTCDVPAFKEHNQLL